MKPIKTLLVVTSIMLASFANLAHADITIRIGGSTAFRGAVHNAIAFLMSENSHTCKAAYVGSNLNGANQAVFVGTIPGITGTTTIETSWSGSVSGVAALAANLRPSDYVSQLPDVTSAGLPYISGPTVASGLSLATATAGTGANGSSNYDLFNTVTGGQVLTSSQYNTDPTQYADLAFSDAYQNSTLFTTKTGVYSALKDTLVGVLPFVPVKGSAVTNDTDYPMWQRITNITSQQWRNLLAQGQVGGYAITGDPSDTAQITATGRDHDSGTRVETFAETGFGIQGSPDQYELTTSGSTSTGAITAVTDVGASGYSSGGTMGDAMNVIGEDQSALGGYLIGYIGVGDADSRVGKTAALTSPTRTYFGITQLAYNGVFLSTTTDPVTSVTTTALQKINNGTYSFWVDEHFIARNSAVTANSVTEPVYTANNPATGAPDLSTFYTALANDLTLTTSGNNGDARVAGYLISEIAATRSSEGGSVTAP